MAAKMPTLQWIALPHGCDGLAYRLTVFVSPRLYADKEGVLQDFPYFVDWPNTLRNVALGVAIDGGAPRPAQVTSLDSDASVYWQHLFPPDLLVRPYAYRDYSQNLFHSFSVSGTMRQLKELYQAVAAASPTKLPPINAGAMPDELQQAVEQLGLLEKAIEDPKEFELEHGWTDLMYKYARVMEFYHRPQYKQYKPGIELKLPEFDFHELVSALGDHPVALRKLGLVVDLTFDPPLPRSGAIRVELRWNSPLAPPLNLCPFTRFLASPTVFEAAPRAGGDLEGGYLALQGVDDSLPDAGPRFDLVQVDPDGSALKLIGSGEALAAQLNLVAPPVTRWPGTEPPTAGLPALRTVGIQLTRRERQEAVQQRIARGAQLNQQVEHAAEIAASGNEIEPGTVPDQALDADDLLRGYRPDILDTGAAAQKWRSLVGRAGRIVIENGPAPLDSDPEGYVKSASTATAKKDDTGEQKDHTYLHEALFRWDGWSLAASRLGLAATSPAGELDKPANLPLPNFPFTAQYTAPPGSLPRLRFGQTYRLAVRAVDLAGGSLQPGAADGRHATDPIVYRRFEPLDAPVLVPRVVFAEGESLERLVIRSQETGDTAAGYAAAHPAYRATCERHIAPPKTTVYMAEIHGCLDPWLMSGNPSQYKDAYIIAQRENGSLATGVPLTPPDHNYLIRPEAHLLLPYLPDPAITGASFWFDFEHQPAGPDEWRWDRDDVVQSQPPDIVHQPSAYVSVQVPFWEGPDGPLAWPDAHLFRLVLRDPPPGIKPGTFAWDIKAGELAVHLAPGQVLVLRCSCMPDPAALDVLAMWAWMREVADANPDINHESALAGLLWMLTPYRTLNLVHAVQLPDLPQIDESTTWTTRPQEAATHSLFSATIHGPLDAYGYPGRLAATAGKLELLAHWADPVDDPNDPKGPQNVVHDQQVVEFPVPLKKGDALVIGTPQPEPSNWDPVLKEVRHEFTDTLHHCVEYSPRATTRFREFFPPNPHAVPNPSADDLKKIQTYEITTHTRQGTPRPVHVPSSVRPLPPAVRYVIPIFGWEEHPVQVGFQRTRIGGGLRVYLDRPWYSTGADEQLAVLLYQWEGSPPDGLQKLVTQFGIDPLWKSTAVASPWLRANEFVGTAAVYTPIPPEMPLTLLETGDPVHVAAYSPAYDTERRLWYADILLPAERVKPYFPFVRLALARIQPYSIAGLHLSPVTLTEFIQLPPSRTLTYVREGSKATIWVEGWRPAQGEPGRAQHTEMRLSAETFDRRKHVAGDPLGWTRDEQQPNLPAKMAEAGFAASRLDPPPEGADEANYGVWSMQVSTPLGLPDPDRRRPLRFVVTEYEVFRDEPTPETDLVADTERRAVYVDTVEVQ